MSGGRRNVGRSDSDGLNVTERRVLDLWDAGASVDAIVETTDWSRKAVMKVFSTFNGGGEEHAARKAAEHGSAMLLAAIRATGRQFA